MNQGYPAMSPSPQGPMSVSPNPSVVSPALSGPLGSTTGPLVWTSPFGAAVAAAFTDTNPATVSGAIAAAAEAETHVRRGLAAAHHWWPGIVNALRRYFAVSHGSTGRKCLALFVPPLGYRDVWSLKTGGLSTAADVQYRRGISSGDVLDCSIPNDDASSETWAAQNIHHLGPDLYLPLMALMTYILLCGVAKGALDNFHPEVLPSTASFATFVIALELGVTLLVFYLLGIQYLPILDVLSIIGLKFESLVAIIIVGLVSRGYPVLFWGVFVYCSFCAAHATFQSLRGSEYSNRPQSEWGSQKMRHPGFIYALCIFALLQVFLCWIFTPPLHPKVAPSVV